MAERPRELDQRFQVGVNLRLHYRLKGYFSRHCDMTTSQALKHDVDIPDNLGAGQPVSDGRR